MLVIFSLASAFFMFKWKRDYVRVAREKRGHEMALPHLERCRELIERAGKYVRLAAPDETRIEDIAGLAEEALKAATNALSVHPGSEEASRLHGQALEFLGNFEEAHASYRDCLGKHAETPARLHLGLLGTRVLARARLNAFQTSLLPEGKLADDAAEPIRRYMSPLPEYRVKIDQKFFSLGQACVLHADRNWEKLIGSANVAESGDASEWLPPYLRGIALLELGRLPEAQKSLETAVRLAPALADPHAWLAVAAQRAKRRVDAIQSLTTALEISEHFLEAWYLRGELLFEEGRFGEARRDFENCLKLRPGLPEVHRKVAVASHEHWNGSGRSERADLERALEALDALLAAKPKDAPAVLLRGRVRMGLQDWEKAEADLGEAAALAPPGLDALALRARSAEARGRWEAALADHDLLVDRAPDAAAAQLARRDRARARAAAGRTAEALADLDALLAGDPNDLGAHLERGELLLRAERHDDALAAAARILEISRGHPRGQVLRAKGLLAKGDAPGAVQEATQAYRADPQLADALVVRGKAYLKQELPGKAAEDWKRALEIRPDLRPELEGPLRSLGR
jgi:tetratricopeptide (TPR) repeat protein